MYALSNSKDRNFKGIMQVASDGIKRFDLWKFQPI